MPDFILQVKLLSKNYAMTQALDQVSIDVLRGSVHALCGENGAGKSTLIKILTGAEEPSSGTIEFNGVSYRKLSPSQSMGLGISAIYQEFSLVPSLTVAENIFLGREINRFGFHDISLMNKEAEKLCKEIGVDLDVGTRVSELGVAQQQIVEILKAISKNSSFIIMDEPTAPLTIKEIDVFFNIIRKLKESSTTILFISHKLEEVFELCDQVTVLCDGRHITTKDTKTVTKAELIKDMVGREVNDIYPHKSSCKNETILEVEHLYANKLYDISFELHRGEILGFGGLVGAGRTELARILFGADHFLEGKIKLFNKSYCPKSPDDALRRGIGLIPEDRKQQGIIGNLSVKENIVAASYYDFAPRLFIKEKKVREVANKFVERLKIATPTIEKQVRYLSGGNQQKTVLSKVLQMNCDIFIFDEPTRGIDIGAKQEIYSLMTNLASQGKSIIMISSEIPELMGMSDRIIVMADGRITGCLNKEQFSQETILSMASVDWNQEEKL